MLQLFLINLTMFLFYYGILNILCKHDVTMIQRKHSESNGSRREEQMEYLLFLAKT